MWLEKVRKTGLVLILLGRVYPSKSKNILYSKAQISPLPPNAFSTFEFWLAISSETWSSSLLVPSGSWKSCSLLQFPYLRNNNGAFPQRLLWGANMHSMIWNFRSIGQTQSIIFLLCNLLYNTSIPWRQRLILFFFAYSVSADIGCVKVNKLYLNQSLTSSYSTAVYCIVI